MKSLIKTIYRSIPGLRELRQNHICLQEIKGQLHGICRDLPLLRVSAIIQALETIKASDPRYRDPRRLLVHGAQYWSQNYEDGMIAEILRRVPPQTKTFLEIGVGDGAENNTTALLVQGWSGWWLDGDPQSVSSIETRLATMPDVARRLRVRQAFVSPEKIADLLREMGVPAEVDLFSLDIDLDTYHIWAALVSFKPRVIVVEYNGAIPPWQNWICPYHPHRTWDFSQEFGASLKAYELLGQRFGYSLVGCDIVGINAFFVRNDLVGDHFLAPFTAENHYEPPRYHLWYRCGHPSVFFGESHSPAH